MRIRLDNIQNFKNVLMNTEQFLDEVKFEVDSDGMRFRGLDKSHVAFISMIISSDYFTEFDIYQPCYCICDTTELMKVFKRAKNTDELIFSFDDSDLKLEFINGNVKRNFKIRQIDMEYDSPDKPKIDFPCVFEVNSKQLVDGIKDAELYTDKVKLKTNNDTFSVIADGEFGDYKSELELSENVGDFESVFSLGWLNKIFKLDIGNTVKINMGNTLPLFLEFEDNLGLKAEFLLAPRIEADE